MEAVLAAVPAFGAGWYAVRWQHLLYREQAFRDAPAGGRKGLALKAGAGVAAAAVVAAAFWPDRFSSSDAVLVALFGLAFVVLAATDFDRKRIPDRLSYPAMALAVLAAPLWDAQGVSDVLFGGLAGFVAGALLFGGGLFVGSGGMGLGDAKLMLLIGLVVGWSEVVTAIFLGILIAGVPAVLLLIRGNRKAGYAYGPYLAAGALAVLLFPAAFG
ncbi:MAG: prepilin peptidase [Dehalococcoidia bacterium]